MSKVDAKVSLATSTKIEAFQPIILHADILPISIESKKPAPLSLQASLDSVRRRKLAIDIGKIAAYNNGIIFGGFVRDLILCQDFRDCDIWFVDDNNVTNFYEELRRHYYVKVYNKNKNTVYPFVVHRMRVIQKCKSYDIVLYLDCVVKPTFPTDDFSCNMLTLDCFNNRIGTVLKPNLLFDRKDQKTYTINTVHDKQNSKLEDIRDLNMIKDQRLSVEMIIANILKKEAYIFPRCIARAEKLIAIQNRIKKCRKTFKLIDYT